MQLIRLILASFIFSFTVISCASSPNQNEPEEEVIIESEIGDTEKDLFILKFDLQDGFYQDQVQIIVNGELLYSNDDVETDLLLGKADSITTNAVGEVTIEIVVESQSLSAQRIIEVSADTFVGIALINNELDIYIQNEPFGYG